jgi:hypothetical protein
MKPLALATLLLVLAFPRLSRAEDDQKAAQPRPCRAEQYEGGTVSAFLGDLVFTTRGGASSFEEVVGRRAVPLVDPRVQALRPLLGVESFTRIDASKLCDYVNARPELERKLLAATARSAIEEHGLLLFHEAEKLDPRGLRARVAMIERLAKQMVKQGQDGGLLPLAAAKMMAERGRVSAMETLLDLARWDAPRLADSPRAARLRELESIRETGWVKQLDATIQKIRQENIQGKRGSGNDDYAWFDAMKDVITRLREETLGNDKLKPELKQAFAAKLDALWKEGHREAASVAIQGAAGTIQAMNGASWLERALEDLKKAEEWAREGEGADLAKKIEEMKRSAHLARLRQELEVARDGGHQAAGALDKLTSVEEDAATAQKSGLITQEEHAQLLMQLEDARRQVAERRLREVALSMLRSGVDLEKQGPIDEALRKLGSQRACIGVEVAFELGAADPAPDRVTLTLTGKLAEPLAGKGCLASSEPTARWLFGQLRRSERYAASNRLVKIFYGPDASPPGRSRSLLLHYEFSMGR